MYAFGANVDTVYLSSADMMTRNTEHRVEIAYPVLDPTCRALVLQYMNIQLADNVKARQLTSEGTWEKLMRAEDAPLVDSQQSLIVLAYDRARKARENMDVPLIPETSVVPPIPEILHGTLSHEFVVSEAVPAEEIEDAELVDGTSPISMFEEEAPSVEVPVPSLISRAQERAQAHIETLDAIAETAQPAQPEGGRVRRALGLFGAGLRTLFRGN